MLSPTEVQMAHDRLVAIILGEVPNPMGEDNSVKVALHSAVDVLCWVLEHDHNQAFAENLQKIDAHLAALGFNLTDSGTTTPAKS